MRKTFYLSQVVPLLGLALWSCWAVAGECQHLTSERGALYQRSAFAHGYIHGYELGFHWGNMDLQLARAPRDIPKSEEYRNGAKEYRAQFGSRNDYRTGYRDGLLVGYTDARSDHAFRAIDEARIATAHLDAKNAAAAGSGSRNHFESGFMDGYHAGALQGVGDGRNRADYRPGQAQCNGAPQGAPLDDAYCGGYVRGFAFGYSDGYINHEELMVAGKGNRQTTLIAARK